jgi:hypothetical protein
MEAVSSNLKVAKVIWVNRCCLLVLDCRAAAKRVSVKSFQVSCEVASNTRLQVEMYRRATNYRVTRFVASVYETIVWLCVVPITGTAVEMTGKHQERPFI